ncbi:hypothetical protein F5Y11DRAFT_353286 [Daldinia sp. FL1419]|nr:hypothetical protein F5Y11DRAFT_353286 [Daldinia sp. FL1419]
MTCCPGKINLFQTTPPLAPREKSPPLIPSTAFQKQFIYSSHPRQLQIRHLLNPPIDGMPPKKVTGRQRHLDLLLISELVERVAEFGRQGKTMRAHEELHRRRIRQFYTDINAAAAIAQDGGESSRQEDADGSVLKRCPNCKGLRFSEECLKKGGCPFSQDK